LFETNPGLPEAWSKQKSPLMSAANEGLFLLLSLKPGS